MDNAIRVCPVRVNRAIRVRGGLATGDLLKKLVAELAILRLLPELIDPLGNGGSLTLIGCCGHLGGALNIFSVTHFYSLARILSSWSATLTCLMPKQPR
jgi:hypothetical protein